MSRTRVLGLLVALALLAPLATLVPTWAAHRVASPPERVFLGFRHMPGDHYLYASFVRQACDRGSPFFENQFTSEPQRGRYVLLYFWALGLVCRATGAPIPVLWEAARVAGGVLYVFAAWGLLGWYVDDRARRLVATAIFVLGGGLDWIVTLLRLTVVPGIAPAEQAFDAFWNWSTFGTLAVGHWVWGALGIAAVWRLLVAGRSAVAAVLLPVVWFVHPYGAMVTYLSVALLPVVPLAVAALRPAPLPWARARANLALVAPVLASFAVPLAHWLWARADAVFSSNTGITFAWPPSYAVGWYPLTYGLLLPLAWFGARAMARRSTRAADVLLAWLAGAFLLSVNPLYQGVKFQYELFPPVAVLAALGLFHLIDTAPRVRSVLASRAAVAALVLALGLDAPLTIGKELPAARHPDDAFSSAPEMAAMRRLDAAPPGVVLCGYKCGNLTPWLAGKTAYFGHWGMTLGVNDKARDVSWFFAREAPPAVKRDILRRSRARYVVAGPAEAAAGGVDPALGLREVYRADGVTIYEVPDAAR